MTRSLSHAAMSWPLREPFTISRGTMDSADAVVVTLTEGGVTGRGEAYGIIYEGETQETIAAQIKAVRREVEAGCSREELLGLLPHGGARCAIDCALWDLEAKLAGTTAAAHAGVAPLRPLNTAFTIGMRSLPEVAATAAALRAFALLKVKVDGTDPLTVIETVRRSAPASRIIVDPNQSWNFAQLDCWMPELQRLGVALLEQPLAIGRDEELMGYASPIPICADELVHDRADLARARGKYSHINIKLDKTGGLTEALALADAALAEGFGLMVGCMMGSSLAMAPAFLVGQRCDFVDLDGPLLQRDDWPHGLAIVDGLVAPPSPELWG